MNSAPERSRVLLVGSVASDQPDARTVPAAAFPRAQLRGRFGTIVLGSEALDVADEWQRLIAHNCAAHLTPGGTLAVSRTTESFADHLAACGFQPVDGAGPRTSWRRTRRRTIHDVMADARDRLERVGASELAASLDTGDVVVVDIRIPEDRQRYGVIEGSVPVARTTLEWRADPASGYSHQALGDPSQIVVVCNEGYSSTLAAVALQDLGFAQATDLVGGMVAWLGDGYRVVPASGDDEGPVLGVAPSPGR